MLLAEFLLMINDAFPLCPVADLEISQMLFAMLHLLHDPGNILNKQHIS